MKKAVLLKWMLVLVCLPAAVWAQNEKPLETFIRQVKETNQLIPVNNVWKADNELDKTELLNNVTKAQPLTIDYNAVATLMKKNSTAISLTVPGIGGGSYTLELAQYNPLGNEFEVHAIGENKRDTKVNYTPGRYYSGIVQGIPGSLAAFSFFNNEVYGIFSIPNVGNFVLVPNTMEGEYYNSNPHYILYNDADIIITGKTHGCGTDNLPRLFSHNDAARTTTTLNSNVYQSCTYVRVYDVADYALYTKKGSSTTNVTNYLTAVFNNKITIYRNENVPIVLNYVEIHTATDVYQSITQNSSIRFLKRFGYETQNTMHNCDVAVLYSTRFSGNMGGVAWLASACSGYYATDTAGPYAFCNVSNSTTTTSAAFPTYSWDVEVTAHEMGHNVGSDHTHACVWGASRNQAIDGCYTLEGSCAMPSPQYPAAKGTIMSYCHLVSGVGINFTNGFGPQPGDTIKYYIYNYFGSTCGFRYKPDVALSIPARSISANRECTDLNAGVTYYWNDNNTAATTDDTLVLMIKKNGNKIGDLNTTGFSVSTNTIANYGTGIGDTIVFPTGVAGGTAGPNYSMRRYWKINTPTEPTTNVEVIYPFMPADSADIDGSAPGHPAISTFRMYKVNSPINPNPGIDSFRYTTAANVKVYNYDPLTLFASRWTLETIGNTHYAHMLMTKLSGGGTGYWSASPSDVATVTQINEHVFIYPNPTNDQWFVSVDNTVGNDPIVFQLYSADGKLVHVQTLQPASVNSVSASALPSGMYFYRMINDSNAFTGNLVKK